MSQRSGNCSRRHSRPIHKRRRNITSIKGWSMPLQIIERIFRLCAASEGIFILRRRPETLAEVANIYLHMYLIATNCANQTRHRRQRHILIYFFCLPVMVTIEDETLPITAERSQSENTNRKTMRRWEEELSNNHADILLLLCCLVSGLVDSTIYNAYGTFVSMQTGLPFLSTQSKPDCKIQTISRR